MGDDHIHRSGQPGCDPGSMRLLRLTTGVAAVLAIGACSSDSGGDVNLFCQQLRSSSNVAAITIAEPSQVRDTADSFDRIAKVTPSDIEGPWRELTAAFAELADLDPQLDVERERIDEIARSPQFADNAARVREYVQLNCGLDLNRPSG
jgi:hypothetical protein